MNDARVTGTVLSFSKGYGFIGYQDATFFVHNSQIVALGDQTVRELRVGQRVSFLITADEKKAGRFRACQVMTPKGEPIDATQNAVCPLKDQTPWVRKVMVKGVISQWRGSYGFINGDDGTRYFVGSKELHMAPEEKRPFSLHEGQEVLFKPEEEERGPVATDVWGPQSTPLRCGNHKVAKPVARQQPKVPAKPAQRRHAEDDYDDDDDDGADARQDALEARLEGERRRFY